MQRRNRRNHEQDKCTRNRADKGSEKRNHICHADKDANQKRIGHFHEAHADIADDADNHGVNNLADNEAREHPLYITKFCNRVVCDASRQKCEKKALTLCRERLLHIEAVGHHNEADEKVFQEHKKPHHPAGHLGQILIQIRHEVRGNPLHEAVRNLAIALQNHLFHVGISAVKQHLNPAADRIGTLRQVAREVRNAADELRNQHRNQRGQHRENDDDTGKGGHHLPDALRIFFFPESLRLGEKFGAAAPAEFDQDALAHLDLRGPL